MKSFLFGSIFISFCLNALAQSHFTEGYIVPNQGDTLRGYIFDNKNNWKVQSIQFKRSLSDNSTDYPLSSFKAIYLKEYDEYYFSLTLEVTRNPSP